MAQAYEAAHSGTFNNYDGTSADLDLEYNPASCSRSAIPYHNTIRVLALVCLVVSICEVARAVPLYGFMDNVHLGAWWGVLFIALAAVVSAGASRGFIMCGCILAVVGVGTALLGALEDSIAHKIFGDITACGAPSAAGEQLASGLVLSGDPASFWGAQQCFHSDLNQHPVNTNNCYCTQAPSNSSSSSSSSNAFCGFYALSSSALSHGYTCGDLNGYYADSLLGSANTLMAGVCASLALAIVTCASLCSGFGCGRAQGKAQQQRQRQQQSYHNYGGALSEPQDSMHQALLH